MNTDKITLPDFVIADLYKECLVDLDNFLGKQKKLPEKNLLTEGGVMTPLSGKIQFLGENVKNITIVVNQPGEMYLKKDDYTFLINILKACQLKPTDIAIVNVAEQDVNYTAIKNELGALQTLLFDVEPSLIKLPFKIPAFQIQRYDACTILTIPALSALNKPDSEGKLLKTKLWNSLKQLFGIS